MELEEYIEKQKKNHELYNEARKGEEWYSHDTSSRIMDEMIKLEQDYFLEHLNEYGDLCESKFENGHLEVTGPNGDFLFGLTVENLSAFDPDSPVNTSLEKLGIKTSQLKVSDDRNSNCIKWGSEADQEVSNILNQTLLLESKFIEQKDPTVTSQSRFKVQLHNIRQNSSQTDSDENDLNNEERIKPN